MSYVVAVWPGLWRVVVSIAIIAAGFVAVSYLAMFLWWLLNRLDWMWEWLSAFVTFFVAIPLFITGLMVVELSIKLLWWTLDPNLFAQ